MLSGHETEVELIYYVVTLKKWKENFWLNI